MNNSLPLKMLKSPLAHELAETVLLLDDVRHSFGAMSLWFQKYTPRDGMSKAEDIIADSLLRDAIVQFIGCFDSSASVHLDPAVVFSGIEGGVEFFGWLKDIRDAYAAHKFGALRQSVAGAIIDPANTVIGIGYLVQKSFPIPSESKKDVLSCFGATGRYLEKQVQELQDALLAEAQAMSAKDLLALENARTYALKSSEYRDSRNAVYEDRLGIATKKRRSSRTRAPS